MANDPSQPTMHKARFGDGTIIFAVAAREVWACAVTVAAASQQEIEWQRMKVIRLSLRCMVSPGMLVPCALPMKADWSDARLRQSIGVG
jgi:hypothetical protein